MPWPPPTGIRAIGSAQTLSDMAVTPDPLIGLEASDAEEAIDELAGDIHDLKQQNNFPIVNLPDLP